MYQGKIFASQLVYKGIFGKIIVYKGFALYQTIVSSLFIFDNGTDFPAHIGKWSKSLTTPAGS